ncbi:MAG: hypothetical protein HFI34_09850 [Lachnospiraceae bacterium]|nr:hypothetical protein [Lachnospiraceae bacterium]
MGIKIKKIRQALRLKMKIAIICSVFIIFIFVLYNTGVVSAIWDSGQAVHINAAEIENSTIAIGTHLIHLNALTDKLYETAYQSAVDSGQMTMYYKSELADGAWINLGNASSVLDLTGDSSQAVSDDEINMLFFEYRTGSDGVTHDLRNNREICVFDIISPYELESMKELEPLKNQYQNIQEQYKNNKDLKKMRNIIRDFFKEETEDEYTRERDGEIRELNRYLQILNDNNGSNGTKEVVNKVMSKVDSARRVHVYNKVNQLLETLEEKLNSLDGEESTSLTDTLTALYSSIQNIEDSYREHDGNTLKEGNTVLSKAEYDEANRLIQHALEHLDSECDTDTDHLSVIYNVNDNVIVNRSAERIYLTEELIKRGEAAFETRLAAGINDKYKAELNKKSSRVVLNSIVSENQRELAGIKGELEFLVQAVTERWDSDEAAAFLTEKLNETGNFQSAVPGDAFQESALAEVEDYRQWLEDKLRESGAGGAEGENGLSELYEEKQELIQKKMEALDKNNLKEADRIEAMISANSEKAEALEEKLSEEINELTEEIAELQKELEKAGNGDENESSEEKKTLERQIAELKARLAGATAGLEEGSRVSAIAEFSKSAMDSIGEVKAASLSGDSTGTGEIVREAITDIDRMIDGLAVFLDSNTKQVFNTLQDIYSSLLAEKYLNSTDIYDGLIQKIEGLVSEHSDLLGGSEKNPSGLTAGELKNMMEEIGEKLLDGEFLSDSSETDIASLSRQEINAAVLAGLARYGELSKNDETDGLLAAQAKKELDSGNGRVFETVSGAAGAEYVPAKTLAAACGYRYIWNDSYKTATLALGTRYYAFTAFSDRAERSSDGEKSDILSHTCEFQGTVYIDDGYSYQEFGYEADYLGDSGYGILADDKISELAAEICDMIMNSEKP